MREVLPVTALSNELSFAINRRSRCAFVRGWPVISSQSSPGAASQVGHWIVRIFWGLSSAFMGEIVRPNSRSEMLNFAQSSLVRRFVSRRGNAVPSSGSRNKLGGRFRNRTGDGNGWKARGFQSFLFGVEEGGNFGNQFHEFLGILFFCGKCAELHPAFFVFLHGSLYSTAVAASRRFARLRAVAYTKYTGRILSTSLRAWPDGVFAAHTHTQSGCGAFFNHRVNLLHN